MDGSAEHSEEGLNPPQREAVEHKLGPLLILAGAGSGKTRVITHRLAKLVERGVMPWRILAVTFTNKAAGEMRSRAAVLLGAERARKLWIGTFHATAARLLRLHAERAGLRRDFQIYDDDDQKKLATRVLADLMISDKVLSTRALLSRIDQAKNEGLRPSDFVADDYLSELVAQAWPEYQRRLRWANAVDFGDLLVELLHLCDDDEAGRDLRGRYDHVLVDEFQDTNRVQYRIVQKLAGKKNLCVVGDDDQAIYRWRGADVRNILDFERDYPGCKVVKLEENYRSTEVILEAANGVIARNTGRRDKQLFTSRRGGEPIIYFTASDERREAEFIAGAVRQLVAVDGRPLSDFAVLYRMHAQSRAIEEALRAATLPYKIFGGVRFFDRAEVKDLIGYLRVIANPADEVSLERIVNVPARGIGDATMERLSQHAHAAGITLWEAMREASGAASPQDGRPTKRRGPAGESEGGGHAHGPLFASVEPPKEDAPSAADEGPSDDEEDPARDRREGRGDRTSAMLGGALLGTGPRRKLAGFVKLVEELRARAALGGPLADLAAATLDATGLLERLQAEATEQSRERIGNLEELLNSIRDYEREALAAQPEADAPRQPGEPAEPVDETAGPSLTGYLERVSLLSAADSAEGGGVVSMMTVHAAKGLEYPVVFLAGMEEGTFPLLGEMPTLDDLEDERRLAYVAITRARQRLVISNAAHRRLFHRGGERRLGFTTAPLDEDDPFSLRESRFIGDIPDGCIARPTPRRPRIDPRAAARVTRRDDGTTIEHDPDGPDGEEAAARSRLAPPVRRIEGDSEGARYVDYDEGPEVAGGFRIGQRVRHAQFGEGRVRKLIGSGHGLLVMVEFPAIGETKKVVARFLQPG